jgi:hypothetical protein
MINDLERILKTVYTFLGFHFEIDGTYTHTHTHKD